MKILLVRPPRIKQAITLSDFMFSEPLGLEMLYGALKGDHEVELFDMMIENSSLRREIENFKPDVVGITSLCIDVNKVIDLCKEVKKANPKIVTVVGGTQATLNPKAFFHEEVDHIFQYTRQDELKNFYQELQRGAVGKTDGVLSRVYGYESTGIKGTNEYFMPDRSSTEKYRKNYSYFGYRPAAIMEFGIGCEKVCDFCLRWRIEGVEEKLLDLEMTKKDLLEIQEPTIMFIDNDFFASKEKIEAFIQIIKEIGLQKNYIMYGSVEGIILYKGYLKELAEMGLKAILVGYETFNEVEMHQYHKNATPMDSFVAAEILRDAGIDVWASFMAHPDWTIKDFKRLRAFIKRLKPHISSISPLTPFPNLPMYAVYADRLLYKADDYEKWSFGQVMIKPAQMSLRRYYYELLKTNLFVNIQFNSNTEMIKTFGGKNSFRILAGSLKATQKYLQLMLKSGIIEKNIRIEIGGKTMEWKYEEGRIYNENEKGELMAEATYEVMLNGEINIDRTYVNPSLRGQGVAEKMMVAVAEYLRKEGKKAMATCSYANVWFKKNEEAYADIIATADHDMGIACKIDSKH